MCIYQQKCIEPLWESKPDYEIYTLLAERLGFKDEYTEGHDIDDWNRIVFEKSDLPKYITYEEFKKKGYFVVPAMPDDEEPRVSFRWFYEGRDPRRALRREDSARTAAQRAATWPLPGQGGVRVARPSWRSTPTTRSGRPWPATSPAGKATTHRGSGREVSAADDQSASAVLVSHAQRQQEPTGWTTSRSTGSRRTATRGGRCASTRRTPQARGIKEGDMVKLFNDRGTVLCIAHRDRADAARHRPFL